MKCPFFMPTSNNRFVRLLVLTELILLSTLFNAQQQWLLNYNAYSQEQGLPSADVYCAVQDQRGYIWLGTRSGLCRFDGQKFESILSASDSLKHYRIESLVTDNDESIIVSYYLPAFSIKPRVRVVINTISLNYSTISEVFSNLPFKESQIASIHKSEDGSLSFLTYQPNGIWHYTKEKGFVQRFKGNSTFTKWEFITPNMSFVDEKDSVLYGGCYSWKVFALTEQRLYSTTSSHLHALGARKDGCLIYHVDSIKRMPDKAYQMNKWGEISPIDLFGNGTLLRQKAHLFNSKTCANEASIILQYTDGRNFFLDRESRLIDITEQTKQVNGVLNQFMRDRFGNYWLCMSKGLLQLSVNKRQFTPHFGHHGSIDGSNRSVRGMYLEADTACVNFFDGVLLVTGKDTNFFPLKNNYGLLKRDSGFWNGSFELRFLDPKHKSLTRITQSNSNEIWSIYQLNDSVLLLGTTSGLDKYYFKSKRFEIRNSNFSSPYFVYRIFRDAHGQLIAVATNGVFILDEQGQIRDYYGNHAADERKRLPDIIINDLHIDKNGIYWIATGEEGLCRWNRETGKFTFYNRSNGLLSDQIYCIQEDPYNNLWLSTEYGIAKFNKNTEFVKTYTTRDGLTDNEFNRGSQYRSREGRVYFGGVSGFTSFDPSDFVGDTSMVNFNFEITNFQIFNTRTGELEKATERVIREEKLCVEPWYSYFSLQFSLLDFENGLKNYAYKLEGLDKEWNYIAENTLRFSNLAYGTYTLVIKAQTGNGYWNNRQIRVVLEVVPPFYKTWWFVVIIVLSVSILYILVIYIRFRQRVAQIKAISELRLRLASDLHDEVGGLLHKSAMQSEVLKNKVGLEFAESLDRIAVNCRQAMQSMRDIMWNLDSRNDGIDRLLDRMREYAVVILQDRFEYEFDFSITNEFSLEPEKRQALFLIYKEALNNILKHSSNNSKVVIRLWKQNDRLRLSVNCDSPYKEPFTSGGQGIRNMTMRASRVGGRIELFKERGVEVYVEMPI